MNMEEIKESTSEIFDNFKLLLLKEHNKLRTENLVIKLDVNKPSEISSSNIKVPKNLKLKIVGINNKLLTLISQKIKLKILITIQLGF